MAASVAPAIKAKVKRWIAGRVRLDAPGLELRSSQVLVTAACRLFQKGAVSSTAATFGEEGASPGPLRVYQSRWSAPTPYRRKIASAAQRVPSAHYCSMPRRCFACPKPEHRRGYSEPIGSPEKTCASVHGLDVNRVPENEAIVSCGDHCPHESQEFCEIDCRCI